MPKYSLAITYRSLFASSLIAALSCAGSDSGGAGGASRAPSRRPSLRATRVLDLVATYPAFTADVGAAGELQETREGFELPGHLRPVVLRGPHAMGSLLRATLPRRADGATKIGVEGRGDVWVEVAREGVASVAGALAHGAVVYADAAPSTDVVEVLEPGHVEELRVLRGEDAPRIARYRLRAGSAIVSMRAREGRIEAVDATGYVQLATEPVFAVDAKQVRRELDVRVVREGEGEGWRAEVEVPGDGMAYPIVVDPVWTRVGAMATGRYDHTATLLPGGKVLVVGGRWGNPVTTLSAAEVFDPATNTWSAAGSMRSVRVGHTSTLLPTGKVLVAGGTGAGVLSSAELYDPATNTWADAAPMANPRGDHAAAMAGAKVLVVGGGNGTGDGGYSSAELYDPVADRWSGAAATGHRAHSTAVALPSGRILAACAGYYSPPFSQTYDPTSGTWTTSVGMSAGFCASAAAIVDTDQALVLTSDHAAVLYDPEAALSRCDPSRKVAIWSEALTPISKSREPHPPPSPSREREPCSSIPRHLQALCGALRP